MFYKYDSKTYKFEVIFYLNNGHNKMIFTINYLR